MWLLPAFLLHVVTTFAVPPVVDVSYAKYEGVALSTGITQWLGIRFAAPPVGRLRFAAPRDPLPQLNGTQPASENGPFCLFQGVTLPGSSEDCLFLSVFAPSNATRTSRLPVVVFIQGGGFVFNGNANLNGTGLIQAADNQLIFVTFNYRVASYGFLTGKEVEAGGALNAGLLDQRKVLEWTRKYISRFGGNPDHVVIAGDSAGASSASLQLIANGGRDDRLFVGTAAIATAQSLPRPMTNEEAQFQYDNLVLRAGCIGSNDTLACLRALPSSTLQTIDISTPINGAPGPPSFFWQPIIDGTFIRESPTAAFQNGRFIKLPAIYGDSTNEGTIFVPRTADNATALATFLRNDFPMLTLANLQSIVRLYPQTPEQFPNSGRFFRAAANAYGELRFICGGNDLTEATATFSGARTWNYRWNVLDAANAADGVGAPHTSELGAILGPENTGPFGILPLVPASLRGNGTNARVVPPTQRLFANFFRKLDPNAFPLPRSVFGDVVWENWRGQVVSGSRGGGGGYANGTGMAQRRLLFGNDRFAMEDVPADQRARCAELATFRTDAD